MMRPALCANLRLWSLTDTSPPHRSPHTPALPWHHAATEHGTGTTRQPCVAR